VDNIAGLDAVAKDQFLHLSGIELRLYSLWPSYYILTELPLLLVPIVYKEQKPDPDTEPLIWLHETVLEKLVVAQLFKFTAFFFGRRRFFTVFLRARKVDLFVS
jgi:hypothetical protein